MSWVKRVLYLIAGLLLSVALLVGGALLYLDDGHYRRLLVFGADHFLDASLKINGDFSFRLGKEITLAAEAVRLTAHDGSYSATIGEFSGKQRLGSYLMTGTFWINSLVLSDVQVDIKQTDESAFDLHGLSLPPVVIQEAQLHNLQLFYTRQKPAETHEISLLELIVDDINNSGPVQVNGAGLVDGRPLSIKGSLGALSELVDSRQPYPLNLDVASGELQLHLSGTIADLVRGEGLDLGLSFTDPNLSKTVQLFDKSAPEIGSVRAQAHLSGSYDAPRLDALKVHLERGEAVAVNITGTVGNLVTGAGLALQVDGKSSDPAVLSWLLYERADRVRSFRVKGKLHEDDGRFYATGVDANAITRTGIEVSISGNTQLPTRRDPHPGHAQQLVVKMYAPTVASLNLPT
jgi:hypothetical protein